MIDKIPELWARPRAPQDALRLPGGRRTLKRLMIDRKIPAAQRGLLPVIVDEAGILGVCALQDRVRPGKDGQIELYKAMTLSLTYDHRALDGSPASRFMRDLKHNLENIQLLLGGGSYHA